MISTFTYSGTVRGQGRPRFGRHGVYESPADTAYKKAIADAYREQCGTYYNSRPIRVTIDIARALPAYRAKRGIKCEQDVIKPDLDNVAKAVLDALSQVAYEDDRQIVALTVRKFPRVAAECDRLHVTIADACVHEIIYQYKFEGEKDEAVRDQQGDS